MTKFSAIHESSGFTINMMDPTSGMSIDLHFAPGQTSRMLHANVGGRLYPVWVRVVKLAVDDEMDMSFQLRIPAARSDVPIAPAGSQVPHSATIIGPLPSARETPLAPPHPATVMDEQHLTNATREALRSDGKWGSRRQLTGQMPEGTHAKPPATTAPAPVMEPVFTQEQQDAMAREDAQREHQRATQRGDAPDDLATLTPGGPMTEAQRDAINAEILQRREENKGMTSAPTQPEYVEPPAPKEPEAPKAAPVAQTPPSRSQHNQNQNKRR